MKKTKATALLAASFAVAMGLTGCFPTNDNNDPNVRTKEETTATTTEPMVQTEYGAPIDPDIQTDYGAPIDYDEDDEVPAVYGPPTDYDPSDDEISDVYGPPADYDDAEETEGEG